MSQTTLESIVTLRHLRAQSGLTLETIRDRMLAFDPSSPSDTSNIPRMEEKGNTNINTLKAFAYAVDAPLEKVLEANDNSRKHGAVIHTPRGRRKKID